MSRWLDLARSTLSPRADSAISAESPRSDLQEPPIGTIGTNGRGKCEEQRAGRRSRPEEREAGELEELEAKPLTDADVESFEALAAEVCFRDRDGELFWLVPRYTGQPRREVSARDMLTLQRARLAFPGSTSKWTWEIDGEPN